MTTPYGGDGSPTPTTRHPGARSASSRTSSATRCCPATPTPTPSPVAPGCRPPACARTREGHPRRGARRRRHRRDLRRLGVHRGDRQADRRARAAHPVGARGPVAAAASRSRGRSDRWCSSVPTSTTPTRSRGASRSPTWSPSARTPTAGSTRTTCASGSRSSPTGRCSSARSARRPTSPASCRDTYGISTLLHQHGALAFWDFAAAAPYVDIEMTAPATATRSPTRTRSSSRRTSSSAGRRRPGCWSRGASCSPTGCPSSPAAAPSPTSTPRTTPTSPTRPTARRAAPPRSSRRCAPGWCSSSSRPSGSRRSGPTRSGCWPARYGVAAGAGDRDPRQPRRAPAVDRVVRGAGAVGALAAPQLRRRGAQRPLRRAVARRLFVRRSLRPPAPRHRPRALARVRARDHRRLRGHQARLGAGELQLLPLRHRRRLRRGCRAPRRARRLAAAR